MTSPIDTSALEALGIDGSGAAADRWRAELSSNVSLAEHLSAITAAVAAAKQRAASALGEYLATAPSPAEIQAAQQELLDASIADDPSHPDRLKKAQDHLGELLAREQAATEKYDQDSSDSADKLAADQQQADEQLSPQARAKLQQLLSSLAGAPAALMGAPGQPAAAPAAGYPGGAGVPAASVTPQSVDSDMRPGSSYDPSFEPPLTQTASGPAPGTAMGPPTLVNATTSAPTSAAMPNVGAGASAPAAAGAGGPAAGAGGGFMPPMGAMGGAAGAGGSGAKPAAAQREHGSEKSIDRDEILNGDDLLNRTVQDRL